ncbi:Cof-type HAD-IIB family hydrolase [Alkalihalobacillus sp. 1P02AB]|uniref:Cof-type HAD-IIB family hydrolase n=1 Tax=Alkalihalobacillus sp. 1P02AB TaxID=3132260 RepID=UPI0039A3FF85
MNNCFSDLCIVTDLDGTLLDDDQQISNRSRQTIAAFQKEGGIFTFATGRVQTSIVSFVEQLNIQYPIITHNGAQIFCPKTKRVIYRQTLPLNDSLKEMLAKLENVEIMYFIDEDIYTNEKGPLISLFEKKEKLTVLEVLPLQIESVSKIIIAHKNQTFLTALEEQIKIKHFCLSTTFSEPEYLELLPNNTSKGIALKHFNKHYNHDNRKLITFGNNINDISLIKAADVGIAVYNAQLELKHVATKVLHKTNQEEAVADYIEKLQMKKEMA